MKLLYSHLIFMLLITNVIFAQQDSLETEKTFGFGLSFDQERYYFPINISQSFRLEPEFYIRKYEPDNNDVYDRSYQTIKIGIGIFPKYNLNKACIYTGLRIGYNFDESKAEVYKNTGEGYYIIPTLGGEYLIEKIFSLGIELQLKYTSYDNINLMREKAETKEYNSKRLSTLTLFFIRIYVW
jgi:hypothetical protein